MSTACLEGGILLHRASSHPCPFLSDWPCEGLGWSGPQQRRGVTTPPAAGPTAGTRTRTVHTAWWHPHTLWGGSVAPQQGPMMIWRLKVWLYQCTAMSQVFMTWSVCSLYFLLSRFGWYKLICIQGLRTGGCRGLENLRKNLKVWKPIAVVEKTICRKIESSSNKGRGKGSSPPRLLQGMAS